MADEAQWFRVFVEASLGVCAELRLPADQVSAESLERTCGHVQAMTSDIGQMFALVHGGERPGRAAGQLMPPRSELTLASATAQLSSAQRSSVHCGSVHCGSVDCGSVDCGGAGGAEPTEAHILVDARHIGALGAAEDGDDTVVEGLAGQQMCHRSGKSATAEGW